MSQQPSPNQSPSPQAGASAPGDEAARKRKRRRVLLMLLVLAIVAAIVSFFYWLHARKYEKTDDAFIEGHAAFVSPKVSGQVLELHVVDNQFVKKGELLVSIDPRDYRARLDQASGALKAAEALAQAARTNLELTEITAPADTRLAQAQVKMAKSQSAQAQAGVDSAKAVLEQDKADANAAEAEAKRAEADLTRYRELVKTDSATQQQLDNALAAARSADAKYEAAQKKVVAGEAQVVAAEAAVKSADESIAQAQAKLAQAEPYAQRVAYAQSQLESAQSQIVQLKGAEDLARLQLEYCTIRAPMDGYVSRRTVEQGAYLQPGQPMLALVDPRVWVVANYKETQLELMKPGQGVTVSVDSLGGKEFKAHVESIMAGTGARFSLLPPENATGNYVKVVQRVPVKIVFDETVEGYRLGPGMSVVPSVRVR